jgi:hypothetical protein
MTDDMMLSDDDIKIEAMLYLKELHAASINNYKNKMSTAISTTELELVGEQHNQLVNDVLHKIKTIVGLNLECHYYTIGKTTFHVKLFT